MLRTILNTIRKIPKIPTTLKTLWQQLNAPEKWPTPEEAEVAAYIHRDKVASKLRNRLYFTVRNLVLDDIRNWLLTEYHPDKPLIVPLRNKWYGGNSSGYKAWDILCDLRDKAQCDIDKEVERFASVVDSQLYDETPEWKIDKITTETKYNGYLTVYLSVRPESERDRMPISRSAI